MNGISQVAAQRPTAPMRRQRSPREGPPIDCVHFSVQRARSARLGTVEGWKGGVGGRQTTAACCPLTASSTRVALVAAAAPRLPRCRWRWPRCQPHAHLSSRCGTAATVPPTRCTPRRGRLPTRCCIARPPTAFVRAAGMCVECGDVVVFAVQLGCVFWWRTPHALGSLTLSLAVRSVV